MIGNIIHILLIHFVADFIFQSREMGLKKGKDIKWLSIHVLFYSMITSIFWGIYFGCNTFFPVFFLTFISHWVTDFLTSKASGYSYLKMLEYKDKDQLLEHKWQYNFWGVIGFDQLIHSITLLLTYNYLIHTI